MTEQNTNDKRRLPRWAGGAALAGAGVLVGGAIVAGTAATAATSDDTATGSGTARTELKVSEAPRDESQPQRSDEELLTGDTATKVEDAVLAAYPDATVIRLETDSDGVYEAHLTTSDGQRVTVEVGEDFTVTGEEAGGHGGPGDGRGHGGPAGEAPESRS
jgi:hypothetical protein